MKITHFGDFFKKGSKLYGTARKGKINVRNILLYINYGVELLNFQEKIGSITRKNRKDIIMDHKVGQFYSLFEVF